MKSTMLSALVLAASLQAGAAVIVSLEPAGGFGSYIGSGLVGNYLGVQKVGTASFSISRSYTGVSIEAVLTGWPSTLDAYLTNQVGPGTTAANEIAVGQVVAPGPAGHIGTPSRFTTVFNNLSLDPGTYYLILTSDTEDGNWYDRVSPIITEASGAHHLGTYWDDVGAGLYAPANVAPTLYNPPGGYLYRVSGEEVAVPEPATCFLAFAGILSLLGHRQKGQRRS